MTISAAKSIALSAWAYERVQLVIADTGPINYLIHIDILSVQQRERFGTITGNFLEFDVIR